MRWQCDYCGQENTETRCFGCGAGRHMSSPRRTEPISPRRFETSRPDTGQLRRGVNPQYIHIQTPTGFTTARRRFLAVKKGR
jgi:hypothetical protein